MRLLRYGATALALLVLMLGIGACSATAEAASGQLPALVAESAGAETQVQDWQGPPSDKGSKGKGPSDERGPKDKEPQNDKTKNNPSADAPGQNKTPAAQSTQGPKTTGWQLGRFKDFTDFAYPSGWTLERRGDVMVLQGPWKGADYELQMTRAMPVPEDTLQDYVESELERLGVNEDDVDLQYLQRDRVQAALITGLESDAYDCPVARVYLWAENPAGRNQRVTMITAAQAEGEPCDPAALDQLIADFAPALAGAPETGDDRAGEVSNARFTDIFTFAARQGWQIQRQTATVLATGRLENRSYVVEVTQPTGVAQDTLRDWVEAALDGLRMDDDGARYYRSTQVQAGVITGVRDSRYGCPVARVYLWSQPAAGGTPRLMMLTIAQAAGELCDPAALQSLLDELISVTAD